MRKACPFALAVALLAVTTLGTVGPAQAEKKPVTAGLLGGLVGLGSGYYYAGNTGKGVTFTVVDLGIRTGMLASAGDGLKLGFFGANLASAVFQGFDSAAEAKRANRRAGMFSALPFQLDVAYSAMPSVDWASYHPDGLDRTLMYRPAASHAGPPVRLGIGLGDPSVGLSWSGQF